MKQKHIQIPDKNFFTTIDSRLRHNFGVTKNVCADPVSALVMGILSQNTNDRNRDRAFERLRGRFPDWRSLLDADEKEIADAVSVAGMGNQRAKRIKSLFAFLERKFGKVDANPILSMKPDDAFRFLCDIDGIGAKTAAVFLLFCGNMPFFPVDTHIKRIMVRLGVFSPKTSAESMIEVLSSTIPPELHITLHLNLIELGRRICTARLAMCDVCPVSDLCETGKMNLNRSV